MTLAIDRPHYATGAIPSLDGIRAVAVSLVFLAHGGADSLVPGGLGVTIFFVLSVDFVIMTLATTALARGLLERQLRSIFGEPHPSVGRPVHRLALPLAQVALTRAQSGGA